MKRNILLLLSVTVFLSACKKDKQVTDPLLTGTILLSGISDNNNRSLASFTYSGKLLAKAVLTDGTFAETHTFNYDSQGNLTGTTITSANPAYAGDVSSVITYNSTGALAEIKFYKANNVLHQDITFTYGTNQFTWLNLNYIGGNLNLPGGISGTYYFTGNNNSQQTAIYGNYGVALTLDSFDNQNNVCNAFPQYLYFATNVMQSHPCLPQIPGLNNPTFYTPYLGQGAHLSVPITYAYNANSYPSSANMVSITYTFANSPYVVNTMAAQYNYSYIGVQ